MILHGKADSSAGNSVTKVLFLTATTISIVAEVFSVRFPFYHIEYKKTHVQRSKFNRSNHLYRLIKPFLSETARMWQ